MNQLAWMRYIENGACEQAESLTFWLQPPASQLSSAADGVDVIPMRQLQIVFTTDRIHRPLNQDSETTLEWAGQAHIARLWHLMLGWPHKH